MSHQMNRAQSVRPTASTAVRLHLLFGLCACLCVMTPLAAQDRPLAGDLFEIKNQGLQLAPARQVILETSDGPPVSFQLTYDGTVSAGLRLRASLTGPGLAAPVSVDQAADNLRIILPRNHFAQKGTYELRDVRLEQDGHIVTYATPRSAPIEVVAQFAVTEVAVERLSAEDLAEMGYLFSDDDYRSFKFNLNLAVGSREEQVSVSVAYPKEKFINTSGYTPVIVSNPFSFAEFDVVAPIWHTEYDYKTDDTRPRVAYENSPAGGGRSYLPALVVIPGNVSYLKDHFGVSVVVINEAPDGLDVYLDNAVARLRLPDANRFGNPLSIDGSAIRELVAAGPDGEPGTDDDVSRVSPGDRAAAQYVVTAEQEGSYNLYIDIEGDMQLPQEAADFSSRAVGRVTIKSPAYNLSFEHPDTVAAEDPYTLKVRLKNESNFPLSGFSLTLPPDTLVGCRLDSNPVVQFDEIAPGEEGTATFDMTALVSGTVIASYWKIQGGPAGALTLNAGVGDADLPISPTRISLPDDFYAGFPQPLTAALKRYLNAALDTAQARADQLPDNQAPVTMAAVRALGTCFAAAAQEAEFGATPQQTLARLYGCWVRSGADYPPLDQLRRRLQDIARIPMAEAFGAAFAETFPTTKRFDADALALMALENETCLTQFGLLIDGDGAYQLRLIDGLNRVTTPESRAIPFSSVLPLGGARRLAWIPKNTTVPTVEVDANGTGLSLSGIFPREGTRDFFFYTLPDIEVHGTLRLVCDSRSGEVTLERTGEVPMTVQADILPARTFVLTHVAQVSPNNLGGADQLGRKVVFSFSKALNLASLKPVEAHISINGEPVPLAELQRSGRHLIVSSKLPLGPFVPITYHISGLRSIHGETLPDLDGQFTGDAWYTGVRVTGRVVDHTGGSVADTYATLWMETLKWIKLGDKWKRLKVTEAFGQVKTGADGTFGFDYVPYNILEHAEQEGDYLNKSFTIAVNLPDGRQDRATFWPRGNGQVIHAEFAFNAHAVVQGRVYHNGVPAPHATVYVANQEVTSADIATTDAQGFYRTEPIEVGPVVVQAGIEGALGFAQGHLTQQNTPLTLDVTIASETARISGRITRAQGAETTGFAGVHVLHVALESPVKYLPIAGNTYPYTGYALTDTDGRFTLENTLAGTGKIILIYPQQAYAEIPFNPLPGDNTFNYHFPAAPSYDWSGTLSGVVRAGDGTPVPGYTVTLSNFPDRRITDASGRFSFAYMPLERTLSLYAFQEGDRSAPTTHGALRLTAANPHGEVVLQLPAEVTISGRYVDAQDQPMPFVSIWEPSISKSALAETDANGFWSFTTSRTGQFRLVAKNWPRIAELEVQVGHNPITNLLIKERPHGRLRFKLIDYDGRGVIAALKLTMDRPGSAGYPTPASYTYYTDINGEVTVEDFNYGDFIVRGSSVILGDTPLYRGFMDQEEPPPLVLSFPREQLADVFGTVYFDDGTRVGAGVLVQATRADGTFALVYTNEAGNYTFTDLINVGQERHMTLTAADPDDESFDVAALHLAPGLNLRHDFILRRRGTLHVRVVDADGAPVDYATVGYRTDRITIDYGNHEAEPRILYQPADEDFVHGTVTPDEPVFTIEGVRAGRVVLFANSGSGLSGLTTHLFSGSDREEEAEIVLEASSSIAGTFIDFEETPIPAGEVGLYLGAEILIDQQLTGTDADAGRFLFDKLPMGTYQLSGQDPDSAFRGTREVTTSPYLPERDVLLRLNPVHEITGTVYDGDTPLPGVKVELKQERGICVFTGTDADGRYTFSGIPSGRYSLGAFARILDTGAEIDLKLEDGDGDVTRDLILAPHRTLDLGFYAPDGTPIAYMEVYVYRGEDHRSGAFTRTDTRGRARFPRTAEGDYAVYAVDRALWGPLYGAVAVHHAHPDTVSRDFQYRGSGTIVGTVRDIDGRVVTEPLKVTLRRGLPTGGYENIKSVGTFLDGTYRFTKVPLDEALTVATFHPETHQAVTAAVVLEEPFEQRTVDLTLAETTYISGRVYQQDGSEAAYARVWVTTPFKREVQADAYGNFYIYPVPVGPMTLHAQETAGPRRAEVEVVVAEAAGRPLPLLNQVLTLAAGASLSGRVTYADGEPVRAGTMYLREVGKYFPETTALTADGGYHFSYLPLADYELYVRDTSLRYVTAPVVQAVAEDHTPYVRDIQFPPAYTLSGVLTAADGLSPTVEGTIELFDLNEHGTPLSLAYSAVTNYEGRFSIERVFPRDYLLRAYSADHREVYEQRITMPAMDLGLNLRLEATAFVIGRVTDADGGIFRDGRIRAAQGTRAITRNIDQQGLFTFDNLRPGETLFEASMESGTVTAETTRVLQAGENAVTLETQRVISVYGTVVLQSEEPRTVTVTYLPETGGSRYTKTDIDGSFRFDRIPAGVDFTLRFSYWPHKKEIDYVAGQTDMNVGAVLINPNPPELYFPDQGALITTLPYTLRFRARHSVGVDPERTRVAVNDEDITAYFTAAVESDGTWFRAPFDSLPLGMVNGRNLIRISAATSDGAVLVGTYILDVDVSDFGVTIQLLEQNRPIQGYVAVDRLPEVLTDAFGRTSPTGLPQGRRQLAARDTLNRLGKRDFITFADDLRLVRSLELEPIGTYTGTVYDRAGQPLADAPVDVGGHKVYTDAAGRYSFGILPLAAHDLAVITDGAVGFAAGAPLTDSDTPVPADIHLEGAGTVTGTVYDNGGGAPIPFARVQIRLPDMPEQFQVTATADASGRFQLDNVPLRVFTLVAQEPDTGRTGVAPGVLNLPDQVLDVPVTLAPSGKVRGVLARLGNPVPGITLTLDGPVTTTVTSDANGLFLFETVPYGSYALQALNPADYTYYEGTLTLDRAQLELGTLSMVEDQAPVIEALSLTDPLDPVAAQRVRFTLRDARGLAAWRLIMGGTYLATVGRPLSGTRVDSSYSFSLPADTPPGTVTWRFELEDTAGRITSQSGSFLLQPDAAPPTVTLTSPNDGITVPEYTPLPVRATAADDGGIHRTRLLIDGVQVAETYLATPRFTWLTPDVTETTSFTVAVEAEDHRGNTARDSITVHVEPVATAGAPDIVLETPSNGLPLPLTLPEGLMLPIRARASDPDGIGAWRLLVNGEEQASGSLPGTDVLLETTWTVPPEFRDGGDLLVQVLFSDIGGNTAQANALLTHLEGTVLTDAYIDADTTAYEGMSLILLGASVIDGTHQFADLALVNGATLTQTAGDPEGLFQPGTRLSVSGRFVVSADSRVDLDGTGYHALPPGMPSGTNSVASHGGLGSGVGNTAGAYDSLTHPSMAGSHGGGGALDVTAPDLWIEGLIRADGGLQPDSDPGEPTWGSGGSIRLTGTLHGMGEISADGFGEDNDRDAGGGGGRIALSAPFAGLITARGADDAGAGTIYLRLADAAYADGFADLLFLDNDTAAATTTVTPLFEADLVMDDTVTLREETRDGVVYQVLTVTGTTLPMGVFVGARLHEPDGGQPPAWVAEQVGNELWSAPGGFGTGFDPGAALHLGVPLDRIEVAYGAVLDLNQSDGHYALHVTLAGVVNRGAALTPDALELDFGPDSGRGIHLTGAFALGDLVMASAGNHLDLSGRFDLEALDVVQGTVTLDGDVTADRVTVAADGILRAPYADNSPMRLYVNTLTVDGEMSARSAGRINLPYVYHHGGFGELRQSGARTHGSLYRPQSLGRAGLIYVEAQTVTVTGTLNADGYGNAGGTVHLRADQLTGTGTISAGVDGGNGGGGRVALYVEDLSAWEGSAHARPGADGNGAGTVFYRNSTWPLGRLVVDNGGFSAPADATTLPGIGPRVLDTAAGGATLAGSNFGIGLSGMYLLADGYEPVEILDNTSSTLYPVGSFPSLPADTAYIGLHRFNVLELHGGRLATPDRLEITDQLIINGGSLTADAVVYPPDFALRDGALELFEDIGLDTYVLDNFHLTVHFPLEVDRIELRNAASLTYTQPISAQDVVVEGGTVYAAVPAGLSGFHAGTLTLRQNALWTVADAVDGEAFSIDITTDGTMTVEAGSRIEGAGPDRYQTHAFSWNGTNFPSRTHAGLGTLAGQVYGAYSRPNRHGGFQGGGVVHIQAADLVLNGAITANGAARGAGGSILIDTDTLSGQGLLEALPEVDPFGKAEAGGGRIAVYYGTDAGFLDTLTINLVSPRQNDTPFSLAGAGTLFLKGSDQTYGELVVDQGLTASGDPHLFTARGYLTALPGVASVTLSQPSAGGTDLQLDAPLLAPDMHDLYAVGTVGGTPFAARIRDNTPTGLTLADSLPALPAGTVVSFELRLDRLSLRHGAQLHFPGIIRVPDLEVAGSYVASVWCRDIRDLPNPLVRNGGRLRLTLEEADWAERSIELIGGQLYLDRPMTLDTVTLDGARVRHSLVDAERGSAVTGLHLTLQRLIGTGNSSLFASQSADRLHPEYPSVFNHGGLDAGSEDAAYTYGSVTRPTALGTGPEAGGAVRLTVGTLQGVDIYADGVNGSGGSIWVDAETVSGDLILSASGGRAGGHGGGGRIALAYDLLDAGTIQANTFGTRSAGTVVVRDRTVMDYGVLQIANDVAHASPRTVLPGFPLRPLGNGYTASYDSQTDRTTLFIPDLALEDDLVDYFLVFDGDGAGALRILASTPRLSGREFILAGALPAGVHAGTLVQPALKFEDVVIDPACSGCSLGPDDVLVFSRPVIGDVVLAPLTGGRIEGGSAFTVTVTAGSGEPLEGATADFNGTVSQLSGEGPWVFSFTAPLPSQDTDYPLDITVTDIHGTTATRHTLVPVAGADTMPPALTLLSPAAGSEIYRGLAFTARVQATDNRLLQEVSVQLLDQTDTITWTPAQAPAEVVHDFSLTGPDLTEDQDVTLVLRARDVAGNSAEAHISLHLNTADVVGPELTLIEGGPYVRTGDTLWVEVQAADPSGVDHLEIDFDGTTRVLPTAPYMARFPVQTEDTGTLEVLPIAVRGFDAEGNMSEAAFTVDLVPTAAQVPDIAVAYPPAERVFQSEETVPFFFETYGYRQDFEAGHGNFGTDDPGGVGWDPWSRNDLRAASGSYAWGMQGDLVSGQARLISPVFPVEAGSRFSFDHNYSFEYRSGYRDGGFLFIKAVDDTDWTYVAQNLFLSDRPTAYIRDPDNPMTETYGWGSTAAVWRTATVDLTPWAGRSIQVAWHYAGDDNVRSTNFWSIDNVRLSCPEGCGVTDIALDGAAPTAFVPGGFVDFALPPVSEAGSYEVAVELTTPYLTRQATHTLATAPDGNGPRLRIVTPEDGDFFVAGDTIPLTADAVEQAPTHRPLLARAGSYSFTRTSGRTDSTWTAVDDREWYGDTSYNDTYAVLELRFAPEPVAENGAFHFRYSLENYVDDAARGALFLELSTDGGTTWVDSAPYQTEGAYRGTYHNPDFQDDFEGRLGYQTADTDRLVVLDLADFAGMDVAVRFILRKSDYGNFDVTLYAPEFTGFRTVQGAGVASVSFQLEGSDVTVNEAPFTGSMQAPETAAPGVATLSVTAVDGLGNSTVASRNLLLLPTIAEYRENLVLADDDLSLEDAHLVLGPGNHVIDGRHAFSSLLLLDGATLGQSPTVDHDHRALTHLVIAGNLGISAGAVVDVSGAGYPDDTTHPDTGRMSGHGYGGLGAGESDGAYGDVALPDDVGSARGGGRLIVEADAMDLSGTLRADGREYQGAYGSGGTLRLHVTRLTGNGRMHADGYETLQVPGGGGGRIAVYGDLSGFQGTFSAAGGAGAGAGTVYLDDAGYRTLLLAGVPQQAPNETPLGALTGIQALRGEYARFSLAAWPTLDSFHALGCDISVTDPAEVDLRTGAVLIDTRLRGRFFIDTATLNPAGYDPGTLELIGELRAGNLEITRSLGFVGTLRADNLTLGNGNQMEVYAPEDLPNAPMRFFINEHLQISYDAGIRAQNGAGLDGNRFSHVGSSYHTAGGADQPAYDAFSRPLLCGGRGGAVHITAASVFSDGVIDVSGGNYTEGDPEIPLGSGGSILFEVGSLEGYSGRLDAAGAQLYTIDPPEHVAAGGSIAVVVTQNGGYNYNTFTNYRAGAALNYYNGEPFGLGAPGTFYRRDPDTFPNGRLHLDSGGYDASAPGPAFAPAALGPRTVGDPDTDGDNLLRDTTQLFPLGLWGMQVVHQQGQPPVLLTDNTADTLVGAANFGPFNSGDTYIGRHTLTSLTGDWHVVFGDELIVDQVDLGTGTLTAPNLPPPKRALAERAARPTQPKAADVRKEGRHD